MATSNLTNHREAERKYRQTEKYIQKRRGREYKARYGLSMEEYQQMLADQNGVCAICSLPETSYNTRGTIKPLCVDHCHKTGKVRKLLCNACNQVIGRADDNIAILEKAIEYLKENNFGYFRID